MVRRGILSACIFLTASLCIFEANIPFVAIDDVYEKRDMRRYLPLIREYNLRHYGVDDWRLENPKMIVVHATHSPTFRGTVNFFTSDTLIGRPDIDDGGQANVGVHFIIDKDGAIYSLIPLHVVARHAVGFNYSAIGIENFAEDNERLTEAQAASTAKLIAHLKARFESVEYVYGHHEYIDPKRAHVPLYRSRDERYRPPGKLDPGDAFMEKVRGYLFMEGLEFKD